MAVFEYGILPYYADDFLVYLEAISGKSRNTVNEYFYDLLMFFRYMKQKKHPNLQFCISQAPNLKDEIFNKYIKDIYWQNGLYM